ncbi:MAG: hypothetical protein ACLSVX_01500 [Massilimicrobiota timonensis]
MNYTYSTEVKKCKGENQMSFMVLIKNQKCTVIASDSRVTRHTEQGIVYNDSFKKVFKLKKNIIVGITGYYGEDECLLKEIIDILNNNSMEMSLQKFDKIAQNTRKTINIFIATPHIAYVVDLVDGKIHIQTLDKGIHIYSSGSHNYMIQNLDIQTIYGKEKGELKQIVKGLVQNGILVDEYIHSLNSNYNQTIGGHVEIESI